MSASKACQLPKRTPSLQIATPTAPYGHPSRLLWRTGRSPAPPSSTPSTIASQAPLSSKQQVAPRLLPLAACWVCVLPRRPPLSWHGAYRPLVGERECEWPAGYGGDGRAPNPGRPCCHTCAVLLPGFMLTSARVLQTGLDAWSLASRRWPSVRRSTASSRPASMSCIFSVRPCAVDGGAATVSVSG